MGERPTGNARALSFRHPPIVRLTNTYIANGRGTLDDLSATSSSASTPAMPSAAGTVANFSFTAGHGYMIRDGALADCWSRTWCWRDSSPQTLDRSTGSPATSTGTRWAAVAGRGGRSPLPVTEGAPHVRLRDAEVRGQAP